MLLSRFWYVLLSLVVGALVFVLYLAQSLYNRTAAHDLGLGLQSDAQVVSWYLKNDARERSAHLIKFAVDDKIGKNLSASSASESKVPQKSRDEVAQALAKVAQTIPKDQGFDAVFAVDQHGRVVAHLGYEQASGMEDFELGGYPIVADALHGFIRDDTLVLDRVYRVVARPVEYDLGQLPAGAIVGARIIDDRFARELSQRTGAAVAFYSAGQRIASGAPVDFEKSQLDLIVNDLEELGTDEEYKEKGRSKVRTLAKSVALVYSRLPGEAWDLGAGYVVGRMIRTIETPLAFFNVADDKDKGTANVILIAAIVLLGGGLGIAFSFIEHSRPLSLFQREARRFAKGEAENLAPSKFTGVYRAIASDLNDGVDVAVGKGGGTRRAADLSQVLGDIPAEPQMSAFSFPGESSSPAAGPPPGRLPTPSAPSNPSPALPSAPSNPRLEALRDRVDSGGASGEAASPITGGAGNGKKPLPPPPPRPGGAVTPEPPPASGVPASGMITEAKATDEDPEWPGVYEEFVATKKSCGENTEGFSFDKFKHTLRKNRDAIVQRHGVKQVKFSVYVKDGKAALKASPIRD